MCQHNLPCSIVYAHCLLPGRAFASLYVLLFLEKEAEIGGRVNGKEEALPIRRIFSLVDMFTKAKFSCLQKLNFQIALMILKFVCLGSICIVSIKIRFKAIHHLQSLENLRFLLPPLILRLYTGCRFDQNFSKSIIHSQKVKILNY